MEKYLLSLSGAKTKYIVTPLDNKFAEKFKSYIMILKYRLYHMFKDMVQRKDNNERQL